MSDREFKLGFGSLVASFILSVTGAPLIALGQSGLMVIGAIGLLLWLGAGLGLLLSMGTLLYLVIRN